MKKNVTQSNDNNVFYKKSRGLLEVALWMQDQDGGVSINDIMSMLKVSKRTAIRIKDSIINWFPEIYAVNVQHNKKKWIMPKGTITLKSVSDSDMTKDRFQTKLEELITLANKAGYQKVTPKQLVIAYYGKYTTQDNNDRKTLSEIRTGLSKLSSEYNKHIDFND